MLSFMKGVLFVSAVLLLSAALQAQDSSSLYSKLFHFLDKLFGAIDKKSAEKGDGTAMNVTAVRQPWPSAFKNQYGGRNLVMGWVCGLCLRMIFI
jgi:hypothetical protein